MKGSLRIRTSTTSRCILPAQQHMENSVHNRQICEIIKNNEQNTRNQNGCPLNLIIKSIELNLTSFYDLS